MSDDPIPVPKPWKEGDNPKDKPKDGDKDKEKDQPGNQQAA